MKTSTTVKTNLTRRFIITFGITVILLLIPLIAMQYSNEVKWKLFDFVLAEVLLMGTGLSIELVKRKLKSGYLKIGLTCVILLVLLLIWAELAVGIFGTSFAGS